MGAFSLIFFDFITLDQNHYKYDRSINCIFNLHKGVISFLKLLCCCMQFCCFCNSAFFFKVSITVYSFFFCSSCTLPAPKQMLSYHSKVLTSSLLLLHSHSSSPKGFEIIKGKIKGFPLPDQGSLGCSVILFPIWHKTELSDFSAFMQSCVIFYFLFFFTFW